MSLRDAQTQKLLLGVLLLAGLGYAFWNYVYTPKRLTVAELAMQAERLERYNQTAKVAAQGNRIAALEDESVVYARRLAAFEELIPTTEQVPLLLESVATAALESDVDLLSFTPMPAVAGTFYTEQFYEVEVRAGYHEIGTFMTRVANLPRIIKPTITELLGERVPPPPTARVVDEGPPPTLVRARLELSTYVLPGGETQTLGAAPTATDAVALAPGAEGAAAVPPEPAVPAGEIAVPAAPEPPLPSAGLAPGVAPALAVPPPPISGAEAARLAREAVGDPGAVPDTGSVTAAAPTLTGPAASDPAPTQPVFPPATPGDLTPPGGRATLTGDRSRPGALPPLGGGS